MKTSPHNQWRQLKRARLHAAQQRAVAEAAAAQARLRFLAEATDTLASSLDYDTALAQVVRLAVVHLADWASMYLLDGVGENRWVARLTRDPRKQALLNELHGSYPPERIPTTIVSRVLRSGEPGLVPHVDDALLESVAVDRRHLELFRGLGVASYLAVPLALHQQMRGVLVLARSEPGRPFGEEDLALAQELARRAVVAIEHARLYSAEQRARAEAEAAVRARDIFFTVAAHELKTPLTSLLGQAQLLARRAARESHLPPRDAHTVATIVAQARRLDTLVMAMLDIARIEQGQLRLDRAPLDVVELLRRVVAESQPTFERHALALEAPGEPALVHADALRLEQVFQNLISNAVKYSSDGSPVTVRVEADGAEVCVSVRDEGIGVPASALPKLFTRFYRAENVDERKISGMGIGLYVVREIVALHGGTVAVESEEARGSTFTVRLPRHGPEEGPGEGQALP